MTRNNSTDRSSDSPVHVRIWDVLVNIAARSDGEIVVTGERSDVALVVSLFIHKNSLSRGWTQSDALRVALKIAEHFHAEVLDVEAIRANIRNGWIRLLEANLMAEPSQSYGARLDEFLTWRGLSVTIAAGSHSVLNCGGPRYGACFVLSDSEYLIVRPSNEKPWRARWESLTRISFSYFEPPPVWLNAASSHNMKRGTDKAKKTGPKKDRA
jgi:hypothetical protein